MVKTMAKLRMAHASTHGARKPPGPKIAFLIDYKASINLSIDLALALQVVISVSSTEMVLRLTLAVT